MKALVDLNDNDYVVIDMTTGTVLGTNLVIAPVLDGGDAELLEGGDDDIFEYGAKYGEPIYMESE